MTKHEDKVTAPAPAAAAVNTAMFQVAAPGGGPGTPKKGEEPKGAHTIRKHDQPPADVSGLSVAERAHYFAPSLPKPPAEGEGERPVNPLRLPKRPPPEPAPRQEKGGVNYQKTWRFRGEWKGASAGGCVNHTTWSRCPQFLLLPKAGSWGNTEKADLFIKLKQSPDAGPDAVNKQSAIGFYVFSHSDRQTRKFGGIGASDLLGKADFAFQNVVTKELTVAHPETGSICIVPAFFDPGVEGTFELEVTSSRECYLNPLASYHEVSFPLEWGEFTAGGSAMSATWRSNPQVEFWLTTKPTRVCVQIEQVGEKLEAVGVMVCRGAAGLGQLLTSSTTANNVAKTKFAPMRLNACYFALSDAAQYVIVPSTFQAGLQGKFVVTIFSDERVEAAVIPSPWHWRETSLSGEWTAENSGGEIKNEVSFRRNPRVLVQPEAALGDQSFASIFSISQETPEGETANSIGFYFYRLGWLDASNEPDFLLESQYAVFRTAFQQAPTVSTDVNVLEAPDQFEQYVIVPCTQDPGHRGKYKIRLMYYAPVQISLAPAPLWHSTILKGKWEGESAGGSANHPDSWTRNPHWHVKPVAKTVLAYIFLRQTKKDPLLNIGMYVLIKLGKAASAPFKIPFSPIEEGSVLCEFKPDKPEGYYLCPATFVPREEGSFEIEIFSNDPIEVVKV